MPGAGRGEKHNRPGSLYVIVFRKSAGEGARMRTNSGISIKDAETADSVQSPKLKKSGNVLLLEGLTALRDSELSLMTDRS